MQTGVQHEFIFMAQAAHAPSHLCVLTACFCSAVVDMLCTTVALLLLAYSVVLSVFCMCHGSLVVQGYQAKDAKRFCFSPRPTYLPAVTLLFWNLVLSRLATGGRALGGSSGAATASEGTPLRSVNAGQHSSTCFRACTFKTVKPHAAAKGAGMPSRPGK